MGRLSNLKESFSDSKKRVRIILILGGILLVLPFTVTVGLNVASNPLFCVTACHDQSPEYESWKISSHSQLPCYACHMPADNIPGFLYSKTKDGLAAMPQEFITGVEYPQNAESEAALHIPISVCMRCHNMATRKVTPSSLFSKNMAGVDTPNVKKYHSKHIEKGINCTICHNRVVHAEPTKEDADQNKDKKKVYDLFQQYKGENKEHRYNDGMDMRDGCLRCHTSEKNQDKELIHHFPKLHKVKIPTACTTCHDKEWSGLPVGHGDDWRNIHGPIAKKDFGYCMQCHDKGKKFSNKHKEIFCADCHGEETAKKFARGGQ